MPAPIPLPDPETVKHTALEDVQGICTGVTLCGLGLLILTHLGLITGQTAGLALILSYVTGLSFGIWFFLVNIPFYWLAIKRMGWRFTIKSLISVTLLSIIVDHLPTGFRIEYLDPILGALVFGIVTAIGLIAIFRHGGSLGGLGVLALYIQDTTGFRAGWVQLIFDAGLFVLATALFPPSVVLYSLLGAVVVNVIIGVNHRRDRYIAT